MRKALGKGIDALIMKVQENTLENEMVEKIPLDEIIPNQLQPRQNFNEESLKELAQSIKRHGLAQPIVVTKLENGKYEIIAGERRYRACKMIGAKDIDAIVRKNINNEKKLAMALIENLQREDLNPVEQALAYKKLIDEYKMNQSEIAEYCGKSRYAISNTLRLLELEEEILDALRNSIITEGHARALLSIPDKRERNEAFQRIISENLTVRDIENYSRKFHILKPSKKRGKVAHKSPEIIALQNEMEKHLGTKVELHSGETLQTGKIIIYYYSLEDFERISNKLKS